MSSERAFGEILQLVASLLSRFKALKRTVGVVKRQNNHIHSILRFGISYIKIPHYQMQLFSFRSDSCCVLMSLSWI